MLRAWSSRRVDHQKPLSTSIPGIERNETDLGGEENRLQQGGKHEEAGKAAKGIGRLVIDIQYLETKGNAEIDKVWAAYERNHKRLRGELRYPTVD